MSVPYKYTPKAVNNRFQDLERIETDWYTRNFQTKIYYVEEFSSTVFDSQHPISGRNPLDPSRKW